jgi:hypothetical protein
MADPRLNVVDLVSRLAQELDPPRGSVTHRTLAAITAGIARIRQADSDRAVEEVVSAECVLPILVTLGTLPWVSIVQILAMQLVDCMSPPPPDLATDDMHLMAIRAMQGLHWPIARKIARWSDPALPAFNLRGRFWQTWKVLPEDGGGMLVVQTDLDRLQYDRCHQDDDDDDDKVEWYIDLDDIHHVTCRSALTDVPCLLIYRVGPTTGKMTEIGTYRLDTPHIAEVHRDLKTWLPDVRYGKVVPDEDSEQDVLDLLDDFATIDNGEDDNDQATSGARDQNPAFGTRLDEQALVHTEMSIDPPSPAKQQQTKRKHKRGKVVHGSDAEDDQDEPSHR